MSNKDDKIKITENIGAELKKTQNKLINEKGSQYKKPQLPKGAKLSKKEEIFVFAPESKKGLLGSNETVVVSTTGKIYEIPLLNIPLALNVLRSLGFNAKIILLKHLYIDNSSYCMVGDAGIWYHFTNDVKQMGCDFLSNTINSIQTGTLNMTKDYVQFKQSIDRVLEIVNKP